MTKIALDLALRFARLPALAILLCGCAVCAQAQTTRPVPPPITEADKASEGHRSFAAIEEEMRAKSAIRSAEKSYLENLDRARNLSSLSSSLVGSYKQKQSLDREDLKKLEKAEKLAKGIRDAAGGSSDDSKMEKPPQNLDSALTMLSELSESLKDKVEKTPKHVISAAVIDEANVLLEVIQIIRGFTSRA